MADNSAERESIVAPGKVLTAVVGFNSDTLTPFNIELPTSRVGFEIVTVCDLADDAVSTTLGD